MRQLIFLFFSFFVFSCNYQNHKLSVGNRINDIEIDYYEKGDFFYKLSESGISLTLLKVSYDPTYFSIGYPNDDVPADKGVCTDVIIRAFRKLGIDLQKEVHQDMAKYFSGDPEMGNEWYR